MTIKEFIGLTYRPKLDSQAHKILLELYKVEEFSKNDINIPHLVMLQISEVTRGMLDFTFNGISTRPLEIQISAFESTVLKICIESLDRGQISVSTERVAMGDVDKEIEQELSERKEQEDKWFIKTHHDIEKKMWYEEQSQLIVAKRNDKEGKQKQLMDQIDLLYKQLRDVLLENE